MNELPNPEILEDWSRRTDLVARRVGSLLLGDAEILGKEFTFIMSTSERTFEPTPIVRPTEEGLSMICNPDSYCEWEKILGESSVLDEDQIKELYLATGLAWVELVVLASTGIKQREFTDDSYVTKAQKRAFMLIKEIESKDKLIDEASKLGEKGIDGIAECIKGLSSEEIKLINRYRYGIAVALQVVDLSQENKKQLQIDLFNQLVEGVQRYKTGLFGFLRNFVLEDQAAETAEMSFRKGFPYLLFASTFPMQISHINSGE